MSIRAFYTDLIAAGREIANITDPVTLEPLDNAVTVCWNNHNFNATTYVTLMTTNNTTCPLCRAPMLFSPQPNWMKRTQAIITTTLNGYRNFLIVGFLAAAICGVYKFNNTLPIVKVIQYAYTPGPIMGLLFSARPEILNIDRTDQIKVALYGVSTMAIASTIIFSTMKGVWYRLTR